MRGNCYLALPYLILPRGGTSETRLRSNLETSQGQGKLNGQWVWSRDFLQLWRRVKLGNPDRIVRFMIPRLFVRRHTHPTRFAVGTATQLSYAKGANTPPLSSETLPSFFEKELLAKFATRPALVSRHEPVGASGCLRWSYEELWKQVNDLARGLLGLGVTKGSRVGVVMGNNRYGMRGQ